MIPILIQKWHEMLETRDLQKLEGLLADDARFHSPILHTIQKGKGLTHMYLMGAATIIANDNFKYIREVYDEGFAMLEFETEVDGIVVNGVDMISWNEDNLITDFKVMIRPLKAVNMVQQKMAEMLEQFKAGKF